MFSSVAITNDYLIDFNKKLTNRKLTIIVQVQSGKDFNSKYRGVCNNCSNWYWARCWKYNYRSALPLHRYKLKSRNRSTPIPTPVAPITPTPFFPNITPDNQFPNPRLSSTSTNDPNPYYNDSAMSEHNKLSVRYFIFWLADPLTLYFSIKEVLNRSKILVSWIRLPWAPYQKRITV